MAEEAKKLKTDNKNIESSNSLYENEIEKLVDRGTIKFINLFHKCFYEFLWEYNKKEEVSANANLDSEDGVINEIYSKIAAKIRSIINHDREEKKENLESKEQSFGNQKTNLLKVINISSTPSLIVHNGKDKRRQK